MLAFGILFNLIGLGFFCWLLFALAVHALPVFAGVTAGVAALHGGAGVVGTILVTLISGAGALFAGQIAFAATRSRLFRATVAVSFATPAALAGYHVALGIGEMSASSPIWREAFALIGAIIVGGTAWGRIARYAFSDSARDQAAAPTVSTVWPATKKG
jgi:hypothetical protein